MKRLEVPRPDGAALVQPTGQRIGAGLLEHVSYLKRLAWFFGLIAVLAFGLSAFITSGLRSLKTTQFGVSNQIMEGKVNARVVITGSSRALSHYDPRIMERVNGVSAFNLGRNGSQTDMQLAVFKAYLAHNRKPDVVIHNLDAFSFVTTREVYDPAQYVPYLYDQELYAALKRIDRNTWKSRYVPLYGYVAEDMRFSWMLGISAHLGFSPEQEFFQGFNPRSKGWTNEFDSFKASNQRGVSWGIEPAGLQLVDELVRVCQQKGIRLIFVYSPEYSEMQNLTTNREEIFGHFRDLSAKYNVPFWDYSNWKYASTTDYFTNSQHLNSRGAAVFSEDVSNRLKEYLAAQSLANPRPQGLTRSQGLR
jgi:hypothetical protein